MIKNAVSNSTVLIALERIDRLEILKHSFEKIFIPYIVSQEFYHKFNWIHVKQIKNKSLSASLKTQMDDGEAEAITLAIEIGNVLLILDDKKARRVAGQLELDFIGTIGLLLRAKQNGIIKEIKPILSDLNSINFRISSALYTKALTLANEQ